MVEQTQATICCYARLMVSWFSCAFVLPTDMYPSSRLTGVSKTDLMLPCPVQGRCSQTFRLQVLVYVARQHELACVLLSNYRTSLARARGSLASHCH